MGCPHNIAIIILQLSRNGLNSSAFSSNQGVRSRNCSQNLRRNFFEIWLIRGAGAQRCNGALQLVWIVSTSIGSSGASWICGMDKSTRGDDLGIGLLSVARPPTEVGSSTYPLGQQRPWIQKRVNSSYRLEGHLIPEFPKIFSPELNNFEKFGGSGTSWIIETQGNLVSSNTISLEKNNFLLSKSSNLYPFLLKGIQEKHTLDSQPKIYLQIPRDHKHKQGIQNSEYMNKTIIFQATIPMVFFLSTKKMEFDL